MPRPRRLAYRDAHYHVMNRGRGRQQIFPTRGFYGLFRRYMREAGDRYGVNYHAYCLMPNHFHLFVSTPNANISDFMEFLEGVYAQKHNYFRKTDGALFRGRFRSKLVTDDGYALYLSRYIHRNPIDGKAPLVQSLEHYPWSSYREYLHQDASWMDKRLVTGLLSSSTPERYRRYVEQDVDVHPFADYLRDWDGRQLSCETIVRTLHELTSHEIDVIHQVTRGRGIRNPLRCLAVIACADWGKVPTKAMNEHFNIGNRNTIPRYRLALEEARRADAQLDHLANRLAETIRKL